MNDESIGMKKRFFSTFSMLIRFTPQISSEIRSTVLWGISLKVMNIYENYYILSNFELDYYGKKLLHSNFYFCALRERVTRIFFGKTG